MMWGVTCGNNTQKQWYLGFYIIDSDHTNNSVRINHLTREVGNRSVNWVAPNSPDKFQDVLPEQIIPVDVSGQWDFIGRVPHYKLDNVREITTVFSDIFQ